VGSRTALKAGSEAAETLSAARRPLSVTDGFSEKFFDQPVAGVEGDLVKLNRRVVPNLPLKENMIAGRLSLFVDWSHRSTELSLKGPYRHSRVLSFNILFMDRYGNKYKYLAFKGVGMPEKSELGKEHKRPVNLKQSVGGDNVLGLDRNINALGDWNYGNYFLRNGIHTTVPVALIRLRSILTKDGETKSIRQAVKDGDLPATREYEGRQVKFVPYLSVKGFSEIMRIVDIRDSGYEAVASEFGLSVPEYTRLWTVEVARNMALMHNLGLAHGYITNHNITVDGRLVDLDSVDEAVTIELLIEDLHDAIGLLVYFSHMEDADSGVFLEAYFRNRRGIPARQRRKLTDWLCDSRGMSRPEAIRLVGLSHR
jgi:hypothetical protein